MMTSAAQRIALPVGDADVYLFALALLGHKRADRFAVPPTSAEPSVDLQRALSQALPTALLRFISSGGGERTGRVLRARDGSMVAVDVALSGRDDDGADGLFDVRLGTFPGSVFTLARDVMPLVDKRTANDLSVRALGRSERQRLRSSLPSAAVAMGDHIAAACAFVHLPKLSLPAPYDVLISRAFARASPLAALCALDDPELEPLDTAALLRPPLVRAVELLVPTISTAVVRAAREALGRSQDGEDVRIRCAAVGAQLRRYVDGLDAVGRLDLVEPALALAVALPTLVPPELRGRLLRLPGVQTMADRDRVIAAVSGLFDVVDATYAAIGRLAQTRFGDDRTVEARVVAGLTEPALAARPAVEAARRALTGVVG